MCYRLHVAVFNGPIQTNRILYMKLYSLQGRQYYTTIDSNNKKEEKTTDNFTIEIKHNVVALQHYELAYIV